MSTGHPQFRDEGRNAGHRPRDATSPSDTTHTLLIASPYPGFCYLSIKGLKSPRPWLNSDTHFAVCRVLLFDTDSEIFI